MHVGFWLSHDRRHSVVRVCGCPLNERIVLLLQVIEMTSVSAAADIWSVGCLCLELLTGAPPYFDLQPMSALFRIVADMRPPLPDSLSPELRDFLLQCFHKVCTIASNERGRILTVCCCGALPWHGL